MKRLILTLSFVGIFILGISSFSFGEQTVSLTVYDSNATANASQQITFKWISDSSGNSVIRQDCGDAVTEANATYVDTNELRRALNFIRSVAND